MRNAQAGSSPAREDNDEDEGNDDDNVVDEASSFLNRALVTVENKFSICRSIKIPILREKNDRNGSMVREPRKGPQALIATLKFETRSHACNIFTLTNDRTISPPSDQVEKQAPTDIS